MTTTLMITGPRSSTISKYADGRLQFTSEHVTIFKCLNPDGTPVFLLLSPVDAVKPKKIAEALLRYGISFTDHAALQKAAEAASCQTTNRKVLVVVKNGWVDDTCKAFVLDDRIIDGTKSANFAEENDVIACLHYDANHGPILAGRSSRPQDVPGRRQVLGRRKDWRRSVGALALHSSVMTMCVGAVFAAPLLRPLGQDPFLVVLTGASSTGKSTALLTAAAMIGINTKGTLPTWRVSDSGLEQRVRHQFADQLFPIDELSHAGGDTEVFTRLDQAAYGFDAGLSKIRHDRAAENIDRRPSQPAGTKTIVLTGYERTLSDIESRIGRSFRNGVRARTVEIPIPTSDGAYGIFDFLPKIAHYKNRETQYCRLIIESLVDSASECSGNTFVRYLALLTSNLSDARDLVETKIDEYLTQAAHNRRDPLQERHARHLALVFGAASYAIRLGLLPWTEMQLRARINICHRRSLECLTSGVVEALRSTQERLDDVLKSMRIATSAAEYSKSDDGWRIDDVGRREVCVRIDAFRKYFLSKGASQSLLKELQHDGTLSLNSNGKSVHQLRAAGLRLRVYKFRLADAPRDTITVS